MLFCCIDAVEFLVAVMLLSESGRTLTFRSGLITLKDVSLMLETISMFFDLLSQEHFFIVPAESAAAGLELHRF